MDNFTYDWLAAVLRRPKEPELYSLIFQNKQCYHQAFIGYVPNSLRVLPCSQAW